MSAPHLAVLVSFSGQGGVEKSFALLLNRLVAIGVRVDLLLIKKDSPHLATLSPDVNQIPLSANHAATCHREVGQYLRETRPDALLVAKHRAILAALRAKEHSGVALPVVGVIGINTSASLAARDILHRWYWRRAMRHHYPKLNRIIAVSDGVNRDLCETVGLDSERVVTVRNPVIEPRMGPLSEQPLAHPWFAPGEPPVVLSAGRLSHTKDFHTLIRSLSHLQKHPDARLVILGEGPDRHRLETLVGELDLTGRVLLPGFVDNPYPWMKRAAVFALSSVVEGSGNVLTEAMALGTSVVSTDCPSGPAEMLKEGRIAPLVPMRDPVALAQAIDETLSCPQNSADLKAAVTDYHVDISAQHYLDVLGLPSPIDKN